MTDKTRPYRMRVRAESQEQTRRRIAESAVELHGTLGPARTSISAVAERAGVRRSTVYRHFADEAALFDACTAQWSVANPLPDLAGWSEIDDPEARLAHALAELYGFYGRTAEMLGNLLRDEATSPLVRERFAAFHQYMTGARDTLVAGRRARGRARERLRAAVGHVIAFSTWRSLTQEQGLDQAQAVALAVALVRVASGTLAPTGRS